MKKLLFVVIIGAIIFSTQPVRAKSLNSNEVKSFAEDTLIKKDVTLAKKYLASDKVSIPEIREHSQIKGFSILRSPKENVCLLIGYSENHPERMAFIWELTLNDQKITAISVLFDGSNPLMNEVKAIKEYEVKNHTTVKAPTEFPFDITHVDAYVDHDVLMVRYMNKELKGTLQMKVVPKNNIDLERFKGKFDKYYTLKDGTTVLYQPKFPPAYQIIFNHNDLRYYIGISKRTKKRMTVEDLLRVANSMFSN